MVKQAVAAFHQSHPWITVKVVGGVNDDKIIAAIRGGNSPDVAQSFTADNTGLFCSSGGWIDLKPYMDAAKIDASMFPQAVQTLHAVQGQALRTADARRHLRPVLQQGPLQEGRDRRAAEDDVRAHGGRQEAHRARRQQLQGRRLRPGPGLLRERPRALRAGVRRAVGRRQRQVGPRQAARLGRVHDLAEGPHRLLRLRQAQALAGRRRRGVLGLQRVRARQAGDGHRRRVPHRVHQGRAPRPQLRHRAAAGGRQPARALRLRIRHRQHRRDPQGRPSTRTPPGSL